MCAMWRSRESQVMHFRKICVSRGDVRMGPCRAARACACASHMRARCQETAARQKHARPGRDGGTDGDGRRGGGGGGGGGSGSGSGAARTSTGRASRTSAQGGWGAAPSAAPVAASGAGAGSRGESYQNADREYLALCEAIEGDLKRLGARPLPPPPPIRLCIPPSPHCRRRTAAAAAPPPPRRTAPRGGGGNTGRVHYAGTVTANVKKAVELIGGPKDNAALRSKITDVRVAAAAPGLGLVRRAREGFHACARRM